MPDQFTFVRKQGAEIAGISDDLAQLRIAVFRDYPYLYEGSFDYEKEYLKTYWQAGRALLFAVYDGPQMVGATTCIPLADETEEVQMPFRQAGLAIDRIFYFGESILLHEYRGKGLGHRFFDEREAHARSFGNYDLCCFCSVEREPDHPAKPADYRPNDAFWAKRGYVKEPALQAIMEWPDLGERESTPKKMTFWTKRLD
jgi:GNAT superfamily N-acetyltransferase